MAVYVDDMRLPAKVGRIRGRWSHLMADSTAELDAFAARLGMRTAWRQHSGTPREHYDVTDTVRALALRLGAVPITYRQSGELVVAKRDGRPFSPDLLVGS